MNENLLQPAFARTGSKDIQGYGVDDQEGITQRQYYAAKAMQGCLSAFKRWPTIEELERIADLSVRQAYEMQRAFNRFDEMQKIEESMRERK